MTCLMHSHTRAHAPSIPLLYSFSLHLVLAPFFSSVCLLKKGQWRSGFFFFFNFTMSIYAEYKFKQGLKNSTYGSSVGTGKGKHCLEFKQQKNSYRSILFNMTEHSKVPPKYPSVHINNFHYYTLCSYLFIILFSLVGTIWLGIYPFLTFYIMYCLLFQ